LPDGNSADPIADLREANPNVGVLIMFASLNPIEAAVTTRGCFFS
jgi:hypothetical protein